MDHYEGTSVRLGISGKPVSNENMTKKYSNAVCSTPSVESLNSMLIRGTCKAQLESRSLVTNRSIETRNVDSEICLENAIVFSDETAKLIAINIFKTYNLASVLLQIKNKTGANLNDITENSVLKIMGRIAQEYLYLVQNELDIYKNMYSKFCPIPLTKFASNTENALDCKIDALRKVVNLSFTAPSDSVAKNGFNEYSCPWNDSEFASARSRLPSSSTPKKKNKFPMVANNLEDFNISLSRLDVCDTENKVLSDVFLDAEIETNNPVSNNLYDPSSVVRTRVNQPETNTGLGLIQQAKQEYHLYETQYYTPQSKFCINLPHSQYIDKQNNIKGKLQQSPMVCNSPNIIDYQNSLFNYEALQTRTSVLPLSALWSYEVENIHKCRANHPPVGLVNSPFDGKGFIPGKVSTLHANKFDRHPSSLYSERNTLNPSHSILRDNVSNTTKCSNIPSSIYGASNRLRLSSTRSDEKSIFFISKNRSKKYINGVLIANIQDSSEDSLHEPFAVKCARANGKAEVFSSLSLSDSHFVNRDSILCSDLFVNDTASSRIQHTLLATTIPLCYEIELSIPKRMCVSLDFNSYTNENVCAPDTTFLRTRTLMEMNKNDSDHKKLSSLLRVNRSLFISELALMSDIMVENSKVCCLGSNSENMRTKVNFSSCVREISGDIDSEDICNRRRISCRKHCLELKPPFIDRKCVSRERCYCKELLSHDTSNTNECFTNIKKSKMLDMIESEIKSNEICPCRRERYSYIIKCIGSRVLGDMFDFVSHTCTNKRNICCKSDKLCIDKLENNSLTIVGRIKNEYLSQTNYRSNVSTCNKSCEQNLTENNCEKCKFSSIEHSTIKIPSLYTKNKAGRDKCKLIQERANVESKHFGYSNLCGSSDVKNSTLHKALQLNTCNSPASDYASEDNSRCTNLQKHHILHLSSISSMLHEESGAESFKSVKCTKPDQKIFKDFWDKASSNGGRVKKLIALFEAQSVLNNIF